MLRLIRFYQRWISPMMAPRCRFYPSCSEYAAEAITVHGAWRGGWLALKRLGRCHPWHPGGVDLVPGTQAGDAGQTPADGSAGHHCSSCHAGRDAIAPANDRF